MGIQGLLPLLKSIMMPIHVKELEGCFVAVDTYSWLHKGALSCSTDLCKEHDVASISAFRHIDYCMHRVNMLRHYGVKPILVFDGGHLPMKSEQEIKRARSRKENLARAMEHESNGNLSAAYECYQKAVDISPSVAHDLIQVLKQNNVSYVVAPYEADAQMTFLALSKQVEAVITEDSDLIAFGCPRIIYKMDKFGHGVEFKNTLLKQNKDLDFRGFTQMMLLEMCILSGCDYLQSLPGMGLKKSHTLMKKFKCHEKVIKHLKYNGVEVTPLYEEAFKRAIMTFKHQRVFDLVTENIVHLSEPAYCVASMEAKREFRAPQITSNCQSGNYASSGPHLEEHDEVKRGKTENSMFLESLHHGDFKTTEDVTRSSGMISYSKCKENLGPQDLIIRDDVALQTFNSILGTPSGYNSSDHEAKKRRVIETDIRTDNVTNKTWTTATCTSDLDEETKAEEGKFSSDITHLRHYSAISEKSMERFISVISSFRYNPSGSRVSGLRAPLRDIKNKRMEG
ncbi:exonuclease 1-like [Dorcoceras hygrometricum]|uniref:Exonuclease 1 n=1 Tax=Dorcoceras hygrometricum TaxID=472368 RepID=A0A2Z7AQH5_9LAMI|nr:exonuclease 1-like [Dorcoceras hygrometricum]